MFSFLELKELIVYLIVCEKFLLEVDLVSFKRVYSHVLK